MIGLTVENLLDIHKIVHQRHPKSVSTGSINLGSLDGIVKKPFMKIGGQLIHDTIFKQAACLMEGIIRLHPFPDGNKRTALLATRFFLLLNKNYLVLPLDSVRFMVLVAQNEACTHNEIDDLIDHIASWLKERTATNDKEYKIKLKKYLTRPVLKIFLLSLTGIGLIYMNRKINYWFAIDMHPEYIKGMSERRYCIGD